MLYCLSLYAQLTISYMLCTYWLSGKAGQDNVWLEVMTYEPRSVISYHFLMVAELNGLLTNWMTHYLMAQKTELLSIEWFTLTIQGATAHWMPSRTRGAWFVLGASLSQTRFFLKFGSVTVSRVFPCYVCSRTQKSCVFGFPSRVSQRVGQVTWHPLLTWSWTKNRFMQSSENFHPKLILALEVVVGEEKCPFFFLKHWNEVKSIDRDPRWYTGRVKEAIS